MLFNSKKPAKLHATRHSRGIPDIIENDKSGLLVLLSRGKRKIGFKASPGIADEGNYLFTKERYRPLNIERHALDRYLDLIAQVGVRVDKPTLKFPVPANTLREVEKLLQKNGFGRHPLIIIHPIAKWPTKQWPLENFARVANALYKCQCNPTKRRISYLQYPYSIRTERLFETSHKNRDNRAI
jgi:ADP-heptose:LPS heptosyltransferase